METLTVKLPIVCNFDGGNSLMTKKNTLRLEKCLKELVVENENPEEKSGDLYIVQSVNRVSRKIPVFVRVYRTTFEHYAVFYQSKKFCKASTYINLKHCTVCAACDNYPNQIRITTDDTEGNTVIFEAPDVTCAREWIDAFRERFPQTKMGNLSPKHSPLIPRSPVMHTLHETDEEE